MSLMLAGIKISERLDKRCEIFREVLMMIEEIKNGICYLALPIDEVFIEIEKNGICKKLKFLSCFKIAVESGKDFPGAWRESVYNTYMPLKKSEKEKLISMALALGRTDSEGQSNMLRLYYEQFNRYSDEAYEVRKKYFFPSQVSGFLFGGAVFILLV